MLFDSVLTSLLNVVTTFFCLFNLPTSCQSQTNNNTILYQWTAVGRILLESDYSSLNKTGNTNFVVHGWTEDSFNLQNEQVAINYFAMDPLSNVILLDYGNYSDDNYLLAQEIVAKAGNYMGNRIVDMINAKVLDITKLQLFGFSLGAHVCGTAAKVIKSKIGQLVPRISAAEPAGPLFRFPTGLGPLTDNLTKSDTDMLDITHTSYTLGTPEAFGRVDTYAGLLGGHQPACNNLTGKTLAQIVDCDHVVARQYFAASILSCCFRAVLAGNNEVSYVYGQHMPLDIDGVFTMDVNAQPPYATCDDPYPNC